jgi:hypothetical protein
MLMSWFARQGDRVLRPKQIAIFEACAIGLVSALAAVSLKQAKNAQRAKKVKVHFKPLLHQAFSDLT